LCTALQWLKRIDSGDSGRYNTTATFSHDGHHYVLMDSSHRSSSVSVTRQRDGEYVSRLALSSVSASDAGLYVCVVTGRYGLRSYRAAALTVSGQCMRLFCCDCKATFTLIRVGPTSPGTCVRVPVNRSSHVFQWWPFTLTQVL